jgi:tRNA threonylcarbamoyl adenosine modification protein (Sua5/YciO/YrdC/YwlC family)
MACPLLPIHPQNPEPRKIANVIQCLRDGGVIVYPTDTVYGFGCDLMNRRAIDRLGRLVGVKPGKFQLSFICSDFRMASQYTPPLDSAHFKLMKQVLPGPFTFILPASSKVPKIMGINKKTVGIRIPDHLVALALAEGLGQPLISTSVKNQDVLTPYLTDPETIHAMFKNSVDLVLDSGAGGYTPSTVINLTAGVPVITRQGLGIVDL